jgi:poly(3-hydroxybutyrate) depolymerase
MYAHLNRPRSLSPVLLALLLALSSVGLVAASPADAPASFDARSVYVHAPADLATRTKPLQVVVALHGMGGEGKGFCQGLLSAADRNGWVVVAPTFGYRNWKDPATVAEDDVALTRQLAAFVDGLPAQLGAPVEEKVVLLGFSRGAQLAHRFALAYPEKTRAVAAMSAGTYTVPFKRMLGADQSFPFGTADLSSRLGRKIDDRKVAAIDFWVAVGGDDNVVADVPRQWDSLLGKTRLQRAQAFTQMMNSAGAPTELTVFKNVGHVMSADMVRGATSFVERVTRPRPKERFFGAAGVYAF